MSFQLLPDDFDALAAQAIQAFWTSRGVGSTGSQGGTRNNAIGGKNLDGFITLVRLVAACCGLPPQAVLTDKEKVNLPSYFRAAKGWDVLVIHERRLIAVFEFEAQVGSFENDLNNRFEEVIGSATDLWAAHPHGAHQRLLPEAPIVLAAEPSSLNPVLQNDPRPPFLAWLMLLEECKDSLSPVRCDEPNCRVFPEFRGASYAKRYQILCERLVERQFYGATALVLSTAEEGKATGAHRSLSPATSLRNLFAEFGGRVLATAQR